MSDRSKYVLDDEQVFYSDDYTRSVLNSRYYTPFNITLQENQNLKNNSKLYYFDDVIKLGGQRPKGMSFINSTNEVGYQIRFRPNMAPERFYELHPERK